jgi:broad specificity polyphosphatase/5'/3'-nucleotidase SurE
VLRRREISGVRRPHAKRYHRALRGRLRSYACSGRRPIVFLGSTELWQSPDLVIDEINLAESRRRRRSPEQSRRGRSSVAGSSGLTRLLACSHVEPLDRRRWDAAAVIVKRCLSGAFDRLSDTSCYWNLNVPNLPSNRFSASP